MDKNDRIIKYAICADNKDPWGVGRIRVIIDDDIDVTSSNNVNNLLLSKDAQELKNNKDRAYIPWEKGTYYHSPDPYVIEPFLPKHLNVIPKIGESVKIIFYKLDDDNYQKEYIGPHISNYDRIAYDPIDTARGFTSKSRYTPFKNNLRTNGVIPDAEDVSLIGRNNSDIVLPDNEVIIRTGHQDFPNDVKNNGGTLIQNSYYRNALTKKDGTITEDLTPIKPINYIVEYYMSLYEDEKTYSIFIDIYPAENITTRNYNPYTEYLKQPDQPEFNIIVLTDNIGSFVNFVKSLLKQLDSGNLTDIDYSGNEVIKNGFYYRVIDNRVSKTGAAIGADYNIGLYQFRPNPLIDLSITKISEAVDALPPSLRPFNKRPTRQIIQKEGEVVTINNDMDESVIVSGADKQFLLSWKDPKLLENRLSKYGFSQNDIQLILENETEPMVRGNMLLSFLLDLLDLFENHGHAGLPIPPRGSLNKDSKAQISNIKREYLLNEKVKKDLSGGPSFLNQYLRLN